jgi:hypothetical protein
MYLHAELDPRGVGGWGKWCDSMMGCDECVCVYDRSGRDSFQSLDKFPLSLHLAALISKASPFQAWVDRAAVAGREFRLPNACGVWFHEGSCAEP